MLLYFLYRKHRENKYSDSTLISGCVHEHMSKVHQRKPRVEGTHLKNNLAHLQMVQRLLEKYLRAEGRRKRTLGAYFFCFFNLYFSCNQIDLIKSTTNTFETSGDQRK